MVWVRRALVLLFALLAATVLGCWGYTRLAAPVLDGEVRLPGAQAPIRIERDADGIPTIRAQSLRDAIYGLGVVHAQDRLWQLETHRRIGSGRLAEAFGAQALDTDRFLRALGVRRAAEAQWVQAPAALCAGLEAYAAGINDYRRAHLRARPPEMLLMGLPEEDWTPIDSLAWSTMMAWDLAANWGAELLRLRLALKAMPLERINQLLPPYPGEQPLATADYPARLRALKLDAPQAQAALDRLLAAAPPSGIEGVGSNNWVVAGAHSSTGAPLLANDPHLKLSTPALWYLARIEVAGGSEPPLKVAGATMPGLPLVVLGQNDHIAWGFTNTGPDVQDLYLERIHPADAGQYQTPDGWARFASADEVIKVRGQPDVKITVRSTRHGPVISDAGIAGDLLASRGAPAYAIALRWPALDADAAQSLEAGLGFNRARSVAEFVTASRGYLAPMQNMVVADRDGHIGFVAAGRVPLRRPDNDFKGLAPAPGWDARYDWADWLPADAVPSEIDPPRGWIATANQRVHAPDYPHYITSEWAAPYRQQRIEQLLRAKQTHSLDSLRAMQADEQSLAAPRLVAWLLKAHAGHPLAAAAQHELQGFGGEMSAGKAAPLLVWAFTRHLTQAIFADEIGAADYERLIGGRSFREALEDVLDRNDAWWCDDKSTPAVPESCATRADLAFARTLDELQAALGRDVARWTWGALHQARSEHRPFSRVKPLAPLFELRVPVGGDTHTLNVGRVGLKPDATTGEVYLDEHGPSLRALYDVANPAQSRVMLSTGQSGLPWTALYRGFVDRWARVEYVPLWSADEPAHRLTVQPGR